jgi:hypothetical protein
MLGGGDAVAAEVEEVVDLIASKLWGAETGV